MSDHWLLPQQVDKDLQSVIEKHAGRYSTMELIRALDNAIKRLEDEEDGE